MDILKVVTLLFILPSICICSSSGNNTSKLNSSSVKNHGTRNYEALDRGNGTLTPITLNVSDLDHHPFNASEHIGFLHGFVESLTVILVSELGDKTFFIAAIMAMTCNKLTIFLAAISALALMTVLSALLGFVVTTFIPRIYTYYTCTAIMLLFGLKMLWEAWRMKPGEMEEIQQEVEQELQRRESVASGLNQVTAGQEEAGPQQMEMAVRNEGFVEGEEEEGGKRQDAEDTGVTSESPEISEAETTSPPQAAVAVTVEETGKEVKRKKKNPFARHIRIKENSVFGKKCYKILKVFLNCFAMTFLAEWGDRSQLATIVLASINDVFGVCVGGVIGHSICTGLAVIAGAIIAKKISVRVVTLIGAVVFLGLAVASLLYDPETEELIF